jgi:hypothetical protein
MISIGIPEKGQRLVHHLEVPNGREYLFVDPENILYDALELNRGVQRTFFSPATAFSFLDRLRKGDGMNDLADVLSKWSRGKYHQETCNGLACWSRSLTSSMLLFRSTVHSSEARASAPSGRYLCVFR